MKKIDLYTDGACSGNPGVGGYGCVLIYNGIEKELSSAFLETTNNRMELLAIVEGLKALKESCEVTVYSDSALCINALTQGWLENWQKNGWKTSDKKDVKNKDLWIQLLKEKEKHKVNFVKVKGHSDNVYNNRCDKLAVEAVDKFKLGLN